MTLPEKLAMLNAFLNGTSAVLMASAYVAIRRRAIAVHRALMLSAFGTSTVFLCSYLTRMAIAGDTAFRGVGTIRYVYFAILISHVILAMAVVPMVLRTLFLAYKQRFEAHRKIARITFPVWLYVSVTGVLVYLFLYQY